MRPGEIVRIETISDYYALTGFGKPKHPLIGISGFDEMAAIEIRDQVRFTLGFYVVTIKYECHCKSRYGQTTYDFDEGVMGYTAPNQVMTVDKDSFIPDAGWCLMFHPDILMGSELASKIEDYHFFDYEVNEALILSEEEEKDMEELFQKIKKELDRPIDNFSQDVFIAQLDLLLAYSNRFYNRQFNTRKPAGHKLLSKFEALLKDYFEQGSLNEGLPAVSYFAEKLNVSVKYFSDMLKQHTGLTAQQHIHEKLIQKAKEKLSATDLSVSEIAFALGFEHPSSFSKLFKSKTSQTPLEFRASFN